MIKGKVGEWVVGNYVILFAFISFVSLVARGVQGRMCFISSLLSPGKGRNRRNDFGLFSFWGCDAGGDVP